MWLIWVLAFVLIIDAALSYIFSLKLGIIFLSVLTVQAVSLFLSEIVGYLFLKIVQWVGVWSIDYDYPIFLPVYIPCNIIGMILIVHSTIKEIKGN
jgi:hypothetical protein